MAKTHHADNMNIDRTVKCTADTITIHGETIIVDKRLDVIKARRKEASRPWSAIWCGTCFVGDGDTRDEAIAQITIKIERRHALLEIQQRIWENRHQNDGSDSRKTNA